MPYSSKSSNKMRGLYVFFVLVNFVIVTYQLCEYCFIWKECMSENQSSFRLPPTSPLCNIRQLSVIKLIQNDPPTIKLSYSVQTEEEMFNCDVTDYIERMPLSDISQFTLASGLYSFDQSYYFVSPLNNNTCLQMAFHVIFSKALDTCDLNPECIPEQPITNCNTPTVSTADAVSSYPNKELTSNTTTQTTSIICAITDSQCIPSALPISDNNVIIITLLILGAVILVSILLVSVCIVIAAIYLFQNLKERRLMINISLEEDQFDYFPNDLRKYLRSDTNLKGITKDDIHVIIRENVSENNCSNQATPPLASGTTSFYFDQNMKISCL